MTKKIAHPPSLSTDAANVSSPEVATGRARVRAARAVGSRDAASGRTRTKIAVVSVVVPPRLVTLGTMIEDYNAQLRVAHEKLGLWYQTGPRRGQQLADLRTLRAMAKLESETRPAQAS